MFVCAWYQALTGDDPAKTLRGTFSTPEAAQCLTAARGGGLSSFASLMPRAGTLRGEPEAGDIGVVRLRMPVFPTDEFARERAAIYTGAMWALKSSRGIGFLKPTMTRTVSAWRVFS